MGEKFVNFLAGNPPLNKLSWLRSSHTVLNAIVAAPSTRWILFNAGQPLLTIKASEQNGSLAYLSTDDVKPFLGPEPFFGQGKEATDVAPDDIHVLEAARLRGSPIVFLGLEETRAGSASALPSSEFVDPHAAAANLKGTPFFSVDVGDFKETKIDEVLKATSLAKVGETLTFSEPRAAMGNFDVFTAGVFAEARSMIDWNQRNKFCPGCGSPQYSVWAGWKLSCSSLLPWADNTGKKACPTLKGLHNFTHPRTDPVVIMLAIDRSEEKILLGRNKRFPGKFYSALAGFMEPGESFEDAVKREMWEEAGVKVWDIKYHSCQPWPYPANLMVGFYATADSSQPIRTDLDNELQDAQWYTHEEVLAVLHHPTGTVLRRQEYKTMKDIQEGEDENLTTESHRGAAVLANSDQSVNAKKTSGGGEVGTPANVMSHNWEPPFRVPPSTALAGVLIRHWAEGKIEGNASGLKRGHL